RQCLLLVCAESDEHLLIDEEPGPSDDRAHPLAHETGHAEVDPITGYFVEHLPAAPQRQQLLAEIDQGGERLVEWGVLVEEVAFRSALAAEAPTEHALAEHEVGAARTPTAVEAL